MYEFDPPPPKKKPKKKKKNVKGRLHCDIIMLFRTAVWLIFNVWDNADCERDLEFVGYWIGIKNLWYPSWNCGDFIGRLCVKYVCWVSIF